MPDHPANADSQDPLGSLSGRFADELRSDGAVSISAYIAQVDEGQRGELLDLLMRAIREQLEEDSVAVTPGELLAANPEFADELTVVLGDADQLDSTAETRDSGVGSRSGSSASGLNVRCPHCHSPIELSPDAELDSITCSNCGSDFSLVSGAHAATHAAPPVSQIGQFRLVERVGMGAFGAVWKAFDTQLERTVAVKIPRKGQFDAAQEKAFLREAQNTAQLNHPGIVPVYEVGREGDTLYIVSDFVRGLTLSDWLTGQQPTTREAAELIVKVADALDHAHERGVIHRDLKPGNIMLDDRLEPYLMDFGLARREAGDVTMTLDGQILGTPAYMSPEQARGEAHSADRRSDLYSLGVILFKLLTGELPFRGNSRMLLHQMIHDEPPSPRKLNAEVSRDLETITLKCLEKDPKRRYASAKELADELRRLLEGRPIHARPLGPAARAARLAARNPWPVALVSVVVLSLAAGLGLSLRAAEVQRRDAERARAAEAEAREAVDIAKGAQSDAARERDKAVAARKDAEESSRRTEDVLKFITILFEQYAIADQAAGRTTKLSFDELLAGSEGKLEELLDGEPRMRASYNSALARLYGAKGDTDKLIYHANESVRLLAESVEPNHPSLIEARTDLVNALLTGGAAATGTQQLREIIAQFERSTPDHPSLPGWMYYLAFIEANVGQTTAAKDLIKRADRKTADGPRPPKLRRDRWRAIAVSRRRSGDLAGAIDAYRAWLDDEEAVDASTWRRSIKNDLLEALRRAGRTEEAIEAAREHVKAVEAEAGSEARRFESRLLLAQLLAEASRRDEAVEVVRGLQDASPQFRVDQRLTRLEGELGIAAGSAGPSTQLEVALRRRIAELGGLDSPKYASIAEPAVQLIALLVGDAREREAIETLRQLREFQPANPATDLLLGRAHYQLGEYQEAVGPLEASLRMRIGSEPCVVVRDGVRTPSVTPRGVAGYAWRTLRLDIEPDGDDQRTVYWSVDGLRVGWLRVRLSELVASGASANLGYMDKYASISAVPDESFGVVDNLVVDGKRRHTDDFESDSSSVYTVARTSDDTRVDWAFDYVAAGLPLAPNSQPGQSRGVRLAANQSAPEGPEAITLHLADAFAGAGSVQCDVWVNYPQPLDEPSHGGTEFVTLGVFGDPNMCNSSHGDGGSGVWTGMNGDGEVERDFQLFVGPDERVRYYGFFGGTGADGQADYFAGAGSRAQEMLYLAMCHHHLGDADRAAEWRRRADEHLALTPDEREGVAGLLAEARRLMSNAGEGPDAAE